MSAMPQAGLSALLRDDRDGIATLTLNRPAQMNLLTLEMLGALQSAFDAIASDKSVRVVVLAAAGKGFCAGHDLKEIRALGTPEKIAALFDTCNAMMLSIQNLPQPVIARVQGAAAAAGCQLVAQCDLAVASTAAKFTTPGVNWGFFCSTPGVPIGRNLLRKHAMEMLLTGDMISAERAREIGLVNRVVPDADLAAATAALAAQIAAKSPLTLAIGKEAFYHQTEMTLADAYAYTATVMTNNMLANDAEEGIDAFLQKRQPHWTGS